MAPLIRGAIYLLLLLTLCMISFALAERNNSTRVKTQMHRPDSNPHATSGGVSEEWVPRYKGREMIMTEPLQWYATAQGMSM